MNHHPERRVPRNSGISSSLPSPSANNNSKSNRNNRLFLWLCGVQLLVGVAVFRNYNFLSLSLSVETTISFNSSSSRSDVWGSRKFLKGFNAPFGGSQTNPASIAASISRARVSFPNIPPTYYTDPSPKRITIARDGKNSTWIPSCPTSATSMIEGNGGRLVLEKIRSGLLEAQTWLSSLPAEDDYNDTSESSIDKEDSTPRILCLVYTHQGAHDTNLRAVADTWATHCDGFIAASNKYDPSLGAIRLHHAGEEDYSNMWQKIRSMWAYAFKYYLDDFDYFHICGDDTYVMVENLKAYVASAEVRRLAYDTHYRDIFATKHLGPIEGAGDSSLFNSSKNSMSDSEQQPRPLLLGMPCFYAKIGTYPIGGPGYTLNRAALKMLGENGLKQYAFNATDSREDVFMGSFFAHHQIWTSDTRDSTGAWRYGGNGNAQDHFEYRQGKPSQVQTRPLARKYAGYSYPFGLDGVSAQTVALHLKDTGRVKSKISNVPTLMRRYHEILYRDSACESAIAKESVAAAAATNDATNNKSGTMEHDDRAKLHPSGTARNETTRPTGLRLTMLGDSVDRYQYLSLTYFLRWGRWFGDSKKVVHSAEGQPPTFPTFLFHEKDRGTWNEYFRESSRLLAPFESCDCYREGSKGDYQHNRTHENRFFYDPRFDNAVAFLWVPGNLPSHGHFDAQEAFQGTNKSLLDSEIPSFETFQWEYTSWSALITEYVAKLEPTPQWLYLNAHYWPNDFPSIGAEVVQAANRVNMRPVWSTATVSNNFKAQLKFKDTVDRVMCHELDTDLLCLNNTWMESDLTRKDLHDYFHFKPHVYRELNKRLLTIMGYRFNVQN